MEDLEKDKKKIGILEWILYLRHSLQYQENDRYDEKGGIETRSRLTYGPYTEQLEPPRLIWR